MSTPGNSYMITNRKQPSAISHDDIVPLSNATLWWYMSTAGVYDQNPANYEPQSSNPSVSAPSSFQNSIVAQLGAQTNPSLTIYIHGLGTEWVPTLLSPSAIVTTAQFGSYLQKYGPYDGLVIGFSWPSYSAADSVTYYASSYPPNQTSGTIRDNINGSIQSFGNLISWTQNLVAAVSGLTVNFICHSEGNYMMMLGMGALRSIQLNQVLMLAADINNGAFQAPASGLVGQAAKIATMATRVTVYYSTNDPLLGDSIGAFSQWHNPSFGGRLGLSGPAYHQGSQQPNSNGVDCSAVVNTTYVSELPSGIVPSGTSLHSTYRYIPQVLADMTQTLGGTAAGSVVNRTATNDSGSYFMSPVSETAAKPTTGGTAGKR